jgi:hypothetical protein
LAPLLEGDIDGVANVPASMLQKMCRRDAEHTEQRSLGPVSTLDRDPEHFLDKCRVLVGGHETRSICWEYRLDRVSM